MVERKEFDLTEDQIRKITVQKEEDELQVIKAKGQLERFNAYLDSDFMKRQADEGLKRIQKSIDDKKAEDGTELDEFQLEDLKIQLEIKKKEVEQDLLTRELRLAIRKATQDIEQKEKNIKVMEKQIRTKKYVQVQ
jgi:hypothetical protein